MIGPVLDVGTVMVPLSVDPFRYVGAVPDAGRLVGVAGRERDLESVPEHQPGTFGSQSQALTTIAIYKIIWTVNIWWCCGGVCTIITPGHNIQIVGAWVYDGIEGDC